MSTVVGELGYEQYAVEAPQGEDIAPSLYSHLAMWGVLAVFAVPAAILYKQGNNVAGTFVMALPMTVVCLVNPFMGLCLLFMVSAVDMLPVFGGTGVFSASKLLALVIGMSFLLRMLGPNKHFQFTREVKVIGIMGIWAVAVLMWCPVPLRGAIATTTLFLMALLLVMVLEMVRSPDHIKQLLRYVLLGSLMVAAVAFVSGPESDSYTGRVALGGMNANHFAYQLAFGLFSAIFLFSQTHKRVAKFAYAGVILLLGVGMIASQSRGIMLWTACAMAIAILASFRKHFAQAFVGLIIFSLILVMAGLFALKSGFLPARAVQRLEEPLGEAGASRFAIWRVGYDTAMQRPMRGYGMGLFPVVTNTLRDPHNNYLLLFVELGLPGIILWLTFVLLVVIRAFSAPLRAPCFLAMAFASMIALTGVTMNSLTAKPTWYGISLVLAITMVFRRMDEEVYYLPPEAEYTGGEVIGQPNLGLGY